MKLYHGSTCSVEKPDVSLSRGNLDFGKGFYVTSFLEQAENWARRKARFSGGKAVISEFDFSENLEDFKVKRFSDMDAEWVSFVCECRRGGTTFEDYDLIIGGVADDKVFFAVGMYYEGLWDLETTLGALRFYRANDQWCFVSQRLVDKTLTFVRSWEV